MMHVAGEHIIEQKKEEEKDKEKDEKEKEELVRNAAHQGVAVLGIAAIVMAEEIGSRMALRAFDRILQVSTLSYLFSSFFILIFIVNNVFFLIPCLIGCVGKYQYGDIVTKRAVPLALGLMCISNPDISTSISTHLFCFVISDSRKFFFHDEEEVVVLVVEEEDEFISSY
jgi:hypothetical protein